VPERVKGISIAHDEKSQSLSWRIYTILASVGSFVERVLESSGTWTFTDPTLPDSWTFHIRLMICLFEGVPEVVKALRDPELSQNARNDRSIEKEFVFPEFVVAIVFPLPTITRA